MLVLFSYAFIVQILSLCLIPFLYLTLSPHSLSFSSFLPPTLIPTLSLSISLFLPLFFLFHLFTQPPSLRLFYLFPLISFFLSLIHSHFLPLSYFLILYFSLSNTIYLCSLSAVVSLSLSGSSSTLSLYLSLSPSICLSVYLCLLFYPFFVSFYLALSTLVFKAFCYF